MTGASSDGVRFGNVFAATTAPSGTMTTTFPRTAHADISAPCPVGGSVQKQSGDRTSGDDVGLSDLEAQQDGKGQDSDDAGGHVDDGLAGEDHRCPGDRPGGCGGGALHERLHLGVVAVADEPPGTTTPR